MRFFALAALVAALFAPAAAASGGCCVAPGEYPFHPGVWPPVPVVIDCDTNPEEC